MSSYNGYIERLSKKIHARLADIEAVYNFELGEEFEVAICHLLSDILPVKFGICRGFIVTEEGEKAGDDIIIFDKLSCPTLRSLNEQNFAVKEQIPIEAVYAYIECKHSLKDEAIFNKAMQQIREVKALLLKRESIPNQEYEVDGPIYMNKVRDWPRQFPSRKNQPFCLIISKDCNEIFSKNIQHDKYTPDLLIMSKDYIATQSINLGPDGIKGALFVDDKFWAGLRIEKVNGLAFGIGMITLMYALSWIELVPIDWSKSLNKVYWANLSKNVSLS